MPLNCKVGNKMRGTHNSSFFGFPGEWGTLRDDAEELSVLPLSLCVMEMILLPPGVPGLTSLSSCFQYQIHSLLLQ